jgi:UDP-glucose:(heptosyl)LPS alpha-1,3-glucosyltransferase
VRIALVAHHARPTGGQDRYVLELARRLASRHEVHLVVVGVEELDGAHVIAHVIRLPARPLALLAPAFATLAARIARASRCDVVHAVGGCCPGASVITAQFCHAEWRVIRRRLGLRAPKLWRRGYDAFVAGQSVRFEARAFAHPRLRQVIAVSSGTADALRHHYGVRVPISTVPNGVDCASFDKARWPHARGDLRRDLGLPADARVALFVGTYERKGLETAIRAAAGVAGLHLVVAGSGDPALARRWSAAAGLEPRLHLLGHRRDVAALYAAADFLVLPSVYEPFGMVVTEAMASGLPVVASADAGASELITDGASGILVADPTDAPAFASAMAAILRDPARAAAMGTAARAAAQAARWERVVESTEDVYRRAVG